MFVFEIEFRDFKKGLILNVTDKVIVTQVVGHTVCGWIFSPLFGGNFMSVVATLWMCFTFGMHIVLSFNSGRIV